jgi:hypothetical protein
MAVRRPTVVFLVIGLLGVVAASATARTWHIRQDGGGDFTTIQPAVDAAAAGDVIEIGPGEYREFTCVEDEPNLIAFAYIAKNLTINGAGMGVTVIGPAEIADYGPEIDVRGILLVGRNLQVTDVTIENIRTTENTHYAVDWRWIAAKSELATEPVFMGVFHLEGELAIACFAIVAS